MHYFFLSLGVLSSLDAVSGHGYLLSPRSRNWEAEQTQEGVWSPARGKPAAENCPQCLNTKAAMDVCGVGGAGNYDNWLDSTGVKMSWDSQATLTLGQEFDVSAVIKANHAGHMTLKVCKYDPSSPPTQACLDARPLEFVRDLSYNIPKDANYPERAYFADVEWGTQFNFKFKVPESYTDIVGEKVLMQWQYVTANSCMPAGYKNSAIGNFLNSKGWLRNGGNLVDCVEPYSLIGNGAPEQFWNCAEVTVRGSGSNPTPTPPAPPTNIPSSSPSPSPKEDCCSWNGGQSCGDDLWCNESKGNCEDACDGGWVGNTISNPTPTPPSQDCCSWNGGQSCGDDLWCNESKGNCEGACDGGWVGNTSNPTPPSDCCSWNGGQSCGDDWWCNESEGNCEGACNGGWVGGDSTSNNCCSWNGGQSCGTGEWCNRSMGNCEDGCSGQWV